MVTLVEPATSGIEQARLGIAKVLPGATPTLAIRTRTPEDRVQWLNILDHGDSGSGKTVFAGTMIQAGLKVLYICFNEDELQTLDQWGITGYDYYVIKDYGNLWPLYLLLRKNEQKYDGAILDGLVDFQEEAKDVEMAGGVDERRRNNAQFMKDAMQGKKRMEISNWGNLLEMTRHFINPFLKLPLHKIVTSISEADEDPLTGKPRVYPALQGRLQHVIKAHFNVVSFSFITHYGNDVLFCMATQPHESIVTKDRTTLNRVLVDPQFQTFLDATNGIFPAITREQEAIQRGLIVKPKTTKVEIKSKGSKGN